MIPRLVKLIMYINLLNKYNDSQSKEKVQPVRFVIHSSGTFTSVYEW